MTFHVKALLPLFFFFILLTGCDQGKDRNGSQGFVNHLANAQSPYLKEHADNPVDWYEWGDEALEKAKKENKPLVISIGYASCHWCHVMEKESFMDTAVARYMNENFVSIKIDREERPDIDQLYSEAAQLISGNSGWPLNAFALPDGKPFYAATYFTKEEWMSMLEKVAAAYQKEKNNVVKQAEALTQSIQQNESMEAVSDDAGKFTQADYNAIFSSWETSFDYQSGGLQGSPKFPMPVVWEYALQDHYLTRNEKSLEIVTITLDKMAKGGIYDQLGGGFARYTTDKNWNVPHFEKMLYDNGQLVSLYAHAYKVTRSPLYADVINKTLTFIKREMTSSDGGFYASLNADSEGEEGKYYVWTKAEIESVLDGQAAEWLINYYQVTDSGNWEHGKNILYAQVEKEAFAKRNGIDPGIFKKIISDAEEKLMQLRSKRVRPSLDDKILVSWNALMLKGYLDAYFALGNPEYLESALANGRFLQKYMMRGEGQLWRNYHEGKASTDAFLEDYALLAKAFIHLYQATFDILWLKHAQSLTEYAIKNFRDDQSSLFYFTSHHANDLVARKMEITDMEIPSSNAVMAEVMFLLGEYFINNTYLELSTLMLNQVVQKFTTAGPYYSHWARLAGFVINKPYEIAIVGKDAHGKVKAIQRHYLPTSIFMGGENEDLPLLENKYDSQRTMIYVCRNKTCKLPTEEVSLALSQIEVIN